MQIKTAFVVLAALTTSAAIGCGGGSGSSDNPTGTTRASLHRAKSCPDLLADLKGDAAYKVNKGIDRQIKAIQACLSKYGQDQCSGYGYAYATSGSGGAPERASADATAAPSAPSTSGSFDSSKTSATSYSQTNTQVQGVDEADIIKNDGKNIYVLHGRAFKVVNAWPANALAEVGTLDVEGSPTEMYVADGRVVIYSQVNGYKLFEAAGVKPKSHYQDYGYYGGGMARTATDIAGPYPYPQPESQYAPLTKITVLKLDGTKPILTREVYFEGSYLDSRRVGTNVRTVLQGFAYGPKLKYGVHELYTNVAPGTDPYPKTASASIAALEQLRADNLAAINASQLGDWLPYTFTKNGEAVTASRIACEDFYVPSIGSTQSGITEVASLDLNDGGGVRQSAILGQAQTVYGSADTLYLAASAYIEPPFQWSDPVAMGGDVAVSPSPPTDGSMGTQSLRPRTEITAPAVIAWSQGNTHVHKFEFASDARFPNYVASGTVPGSVKNQFSMDDKDGFLRIATTEQRQYVTVEGRYVAPEPQLRPDTLNHVFTLGVAGPWLDIKGEVRDLAPGEQIYSVRFVGTRGYVVTFRQVDPLFVVDLADPLKPTLLAALKIPGFSDYMHPIDANHLLTIGRDATLEGRVRGLQLQIFDVTDGRNPILTQKYTYSGTEYGQSEATYDHKAFTFFAEKSLLAFPYYSYSTTGSFRSSLEVFKVDVTTGFQKLGSIDHTPLLQSSPTGYCGGYYAPSVRRGVFLENIAYAISYGGIVAKDVNNLAAAGTQLAFPAPVANVTYGAPIACAM
jgi:uncharacterized secreted protein with C-terminal beta-propeller domain